MTDLFAHAIRCGRFFAELTWKTGGPFFFGGLLVICWILSKLWKWSLLVACAVRVGSKRRGSVTTSTCFHQRLHFLHKAAPALNSHGRTTSTRGLSCPLWSQALLSGLVQHQHIGLRSTLSKSVHSILLVQPLLCKHCMPIKLLLQWCIYSNVVVGTPHQSTCSLCPSLLPIE